MTRAFTVDGGVVEGTKETFNSLDEFIGELLAKDMRSARDAPV